MVLVVSSNGESIDQSILRQLLQKGVMVVLFGGRGTQTKDLQHYLSGNRNNFGNMLDDLQATVEFIGNEMTQNISLYCKGEVSSLVGLWFNFYFPYLFNASALHVRLEILRTAFIILRMPSPLRPSRTFSGKFQSKERRLHKDSILRSLTCSAINSGRWVCGTRVNRRKNIVLERYRM